MVFLAYQLVRALNWLLWIGFVAFCLYFRADRAPHVDAFGNLTHFTEIVLYTLPVTAMFVGLFQMYLWDLAYGETRSQTTTGGNGLR